MIQKSKFIKLALLKNGADGNLNQNRRVPMLHREELKKSLEIIYSNGDDELKQKVKNLINTLIEKGSSVYWGLKDVLLHEK